MANARKAKIETKESETTPTATASERLLSEKDRQAMIGDLVEWGNGEKESFSTLSDLELMKKVSECAREFKKKSSSKEVDNLQDRLNSYVSQSTGELPSKEMITKLYYLSVPPIYLQLFRDQDANLTEKEIWQVIRESRIEPIGEIKEIFRDRAREATPIIRKGRPHHDELF